MYCEDSNAHLVRKDSVDLKVSFRNDFHVSVFKIIVRIHKNEQLLDWPCRLLLKALCIKTSNYWQVKAIDL